MKKAKWLFKHEGLRHAIAMLAMLLDIVLGCQRPNTKGQGGLLDNQNSAELNVGVDQMIEERSWNTIEVKVPGTLRIGPEFSWDTVKEIYSNRNSPRAFHNRDFSSYHYKVLSFEDRTLIITGGRQKHYPQL
ncbi:hypothetical protein Tco_0705203 [Tanacetum coccineum]|uniref:Uncharacterized protein n=1 Tax=Tanacetum coccineum TaxID=301880 RepID=A0ABQ4Y4U1_9ASTR